MKAKIKAKDFKRVLKAALSLQKLGTKTTKEEDKAFQPKCVISVQENKVTIESANMGAYIALTVPAVTLRPGTIGANLALLEKMRMSGDTTIEFDERSSTIRVYGKKFSYDTQLEQEAIDLVRASRPDPGRMQDVVRLPSQLLAKAAGYVSLEPLLKQEDMRMQFCFSTTGENRSIEVMGLDHYCYGRFLRESNDIQIRVPSQFILRAEALSAILKNVTGDFVVVGVQKDDQDTTVLVRFQAEDADIYYPTLDLPFQDASAVYQQTVSGRMDASFSALRKNLREALSTVKTVAIGDTPLILNVRVEKEKVQIGAQQDDNVAVAEVTTKEPPQVAAGDVHLMFLTQRYFSEIINLAPEVVPIRVQSWNGNRVIVEARGVENGKIEYFMAQVNVQEQES